MSAEPKLDLDLDAIEARICRATPGPWLVKDQDPKQIHRGTVQVQENGHGVGHGSPACDHRGVHGDYGMYVRACIEHILLQELLKQDRK